MDEDPIGRNKYEAVSGSTTNIRGRWNVVSDRRGGGGPRIFTIVVVAYVFDRRQEYRRPQTPQMLYTPDRSFLTHLPDCRAA